MDQSTAWMARGNYDGQGRPTQSNLSGKINPVHRPSQTNVSEYKVNFVAAHQHDS